MSAQFQILSLMRRQPRKWKSYDIANALGFDTAFAREQLKEMADEGLIRVEVKRERSYFLPEESFAAVDESARSVAKSREVQMLRRPEMKGYEARLRAQEAMALSTRR